MITHKEVKRFLSNFDYWLNEQTAEMVQKYLSNYIAQQEAQSKRLAKVEELLELYRNSSMETDIDYRMHYWQVIDDLEKEVFDIFKDLEKELEELK